MKIDVRSENSVYITINGFTYYIDDGTNEQMVCMWPVGEPYDDDKDDRLVPVDQKD